MGSLRSPMFLQELAGAQPEKHRVPARAWPLWMFGNSFTLYFAFLMKGACAVSWKPLHTFSGIQQHQLIGYEKNPISSSKMLCLLHSLSNIVLIQFCKSHLQSVMI